MEHYVILALTVVITGVLIYCKVVLDKLDQSYIKYAGLTYEYCTLNKKYLATRR